jgi:predicted nucleic acid-binding Zn ribbon protein
MNARRRRLRRRTRHAQTAAELVAAVCSEYGLTQAVRELRVVIHWHEIVGERIARRAWPDGLSRGVLWVRVANAAWMHELSFVRAQILEGANRVMGDPPLASDVRLHLGRRSAIDDKDLVAATAERRQQPAARRPPAEPVPARGSDLRRIDGEVAAVEDLELRALIGAVRRRHNV